VCVCVYVYKGCNLITVRLTGSVFVRARVYIGGLVYLQFAHKLTMKLINWVSETVVQNHELKRKFCKLRLVTHFIRELKLRNKSQNMFSDSGIEIFCPPQMDAE
jgi:hypothetical protein